MWGRGEVHGGGGGSSKEGAKKKSVAKPNIAPTFME